MTDNKDVRHKPSYDGREPFYININKMLFAVNSTLTMGDYKAGSRALYLLYNMLCPYMKPEDKDTIGYKVKEVYKEVNYINNISHFKSHTYAMQTNVKAKNVDEKILELHTRLFEASKDLWLPISNDETREFSEEEFMSESI